MIQKIPAFSFEQIFFLIQEMQSLIGCIVTGCKGSLPSSFTLFLRNETTTERLFFCLDKPFPRFHVSRKKKAKGAHPLESFLLDASLNAVKVIDKDRVVCLEFCKDNKVLTLVIEFFSKHPNYYLIDKDYTIQYSLHPIKATRYAFPAQRPFQSQTGRLLNHEEVEDIFTQLEKDYHFEQDKKFILSSIQKKLQQVLRRREKYDQELKNSLNWEAVQHEGELLKAYCGLLKRGLKEIHVLDWLNDTTVRLTLDPTLSPQDQIKSVFRKSKKMRAGIMHIEAQQANNDRLITLLQNDLDRIGCINNPDELIQEKAKWAPLKQEKVSINKQKNMPYREFKSSNGTKIWVGKSAKDNEQLTFNLANGLDWWLHVSGYAGSHVVVKTRKGEKPDEETLADALQLALYYSKAKQQGEAEICMTQRKYVSRFGRGKPGQVQISQSKTFFVKVDPERYHAVKEREF